MAKTLLTFQKFNDIGLANEIAEKLKQHDVPYLLEDNQGLFDPSFAYNTIAPDINLKLRPEDFSRAHKALEEYYAKQFDDVDKDYYLFEFTDEELQEIVSKPDEWGHFDYQLAQKILRERGKEIQPEAAELLRSERNKDLAEPESASKWWIFAGYLTAIFGGLIGIVIGYILASFKKTLPDGQRVYVYKKEDRNHGVRILLISFLSIILWFVTRQWLINEF